MEPNYGATDDEANTPLMESQPLLTEKPRRGRAVATAAVVGTLCMAATVSTTGQQKIADLRASLRTPRGTPSVDWVYDLTVTQDQFWQLTCDLSTPGTQPYALCGLTTCSGLEDYPDVAACKCAPETVNEMFDGTPMESTFRMGSSTIYLSQSETYRNAVAAQYAGTLDLPAFCTALTDGTICEESGLGCDFISFHTGATNEECRRKALAKGTSHSEAKTHVQTSKGDSNAGFAWEIDVVEVCMGAPCYKLEGNMGDDSDGCQMACLCPIGAGELAPTFYDDALAADFTDQCFQATTVSTSWTPSLKQVNTLVSTLVEAGKDSAQQAANCDCTVSTAC